MKKTANLIVKLIEAEELHNAQITAEKLQKEEARYSESLKIAKRIQRKSASISEILGTATIKSHE